MFERASGNDLKMDPSSFITILVESDQLLKLRQITNEVVLPIIIIIGIVLNTVGLICFAKAKRRNDDVTYIYALCLGTSSLASMFLYIPFVLQNATEIECLSWLGAWYQAHLQLPLVNTCLTLSVHILVWMSLERYVSVFQPTSFHRIHRKSIAKAGVLVSLAIAIITQGPLAMYQKIVWYIHHSRL